MIAMSDTSGRTVMRETAIGAFVTAEVEYAPGVVLTRHSHPTPRFSLVLSGRLMEECSGRTLESEPGVVGFRPASVQHMNAFDIRTRCLTIALPAGMLSGLPHRERTVPHERTFDIAHQIRREIDTRDAASPLIVQGLLLQLAGFLVRGDTPAAAPEWLLAVREHLRSSATDRQSLSEVAGRFGVNRSYLASAFRRAFGCTVFSYIRQRQIGVAMQLLVETEKPLSTIALDAGFADQSHFARVFKGVVGKQPSAYRRGVRQTKNRTSY
jgi:AraC family transcriptional regulator